jgi:hypothetical protein
LYDSNRMRKFETLKFHINEKHFIGRVRIRNGKPSGGCEIPSNS